MPNLNQAKNAINEYRISHNELSAKGWYKGIAEDHIPLLNKLLADLKVAGFNSLEEFEQAYEKQFEELP